MQEALQTKDVGVTPKYFIQGTRYYLSGILYFTEILVGYPNKKETHNNLYEFGYIFV